MFGHMRRTVGGKAPPMNDRQTYSFDILGF